MIQKFLVALSLVAISTAALAQYPSGAEVGRQEMAKVKAEKARNDRIVAEQRARDKAEKERPRKESKTTSGDSTRASGDNTKASGDGTRASRREP